ncbi:MAG: CTP synthase [Bacteroidales bacterium]|nr:CTP synthase [Bacteroidales bacterium]
MKNTKYIFVTGGVTSSLGKGIISASLAKLLQLRGYNVTVQKFDPYLNVDPGTLNPYEHGECYVTIDGAETDLDLGHYERFLNIHTTQDNNVTTGKIYSNVINKERRGDYLGKTVQIIPHITDEIKRYIKLLGSKYGYEIVITEIGGTVGDIESLPFIESVRQIRWEMPENTLVIHLTLVPYLSATGELKTKPTQHSVKMLLENGIQPDIIVLRTEHSITQEIRRKVALFCNVENEAVIEAKNVKTIYEVPLYLHEEKFDTIVLKKLKLPEKKEPDLTKWKSFVDKIKNPDYSTNVALVGKYVELADAYKSIIESLIHAGATNNAKVNIKLVHSERIEENNLNETFKDIKGIIVAPGFGSRGIEGKILAIKYARENNIPFLGICLGMQLAVIEFARNVLHYKDANSTEFVRNTNYPVIDLMESQKSIVDKGGTMRLGAYNCELLPESKAYSIYKKNIIKERHRHRYEFNNRYLEEFKKAGMVVSGINPEMNLVEIIELPSHKWFIGVQFHPEFNSTVENPHPLFVDFIKTCLE